MKTLERLEKLLDEKETQIERLQEEIDKKNYEDQWRWRHIREYTEQENLDLPLPRLEIRITFSKYRTLADYGLVYRHFLKTILFSPLGSTETNGANRYEPTTREEIIRTYLPYRDGAHIYHDMQHLNLPGYLIVNNIAYELKDKSER